MVPQRKAQNFCRICFLLNDLGPRQCELLNKNTTSFLENLKIAVPKNKSVRGALTLGEWLPKLELNCHERSSSVFEVKNIRDGQSINLT